MAIKHFIYEKKNINLRSTFLYKKQITSEERLSNGNDPFQPTIHNWWGYSHECRFNASNSCSC